MGRVLMIGAGGVATVAAFKIVQNQDVFTDFMIASRRKEKCDELVKSIHNKGYKADITIVAPDQPWTVNEDCIQSKCKWSPMMGHTYQWRVLHTFCNGNHLLNKEEFDNTIHGERITFRNDN